MCKKSPSSILTKTRVVKIHFNEKICISMKGWEWTKKARHFVFFFPGQFWACVKIHMTRDVYWAPLAASRHETSGNLLTSLTRRGGDFSSQFSSGAVFPVMAYTSLPESRHLSPRAANIIISRRKKKEETLFKLSSWNLTPLNLSFSFVFTFCIVQVL